MNSPRKLTSKTRTTHLDMYVLWAVICEISPYSSYLKVSVQNSTVVGSKWRVNKLNTKGKAPQPVTRLV